MQEKKTDTNPLELTLEAKVASISLDESVLVRVILRNIGSAPITVNSRMLLNHPTAPDAAREIDMAISGPTNYINLKRFHVNAGPASPNHFVVLQPEESVECHYDLTQYFSLHVPGEYKIVARYTNRSQESIYGKRPWVGSLTSEAITIKRL